MTAVTNNGEKQMLDLTTVVYNIPADLKVIRLEFFGASARKQKNSYPIA